MFKNYHQTLNNLLNHLKLIF